MRKTSIILFLVALLSTSCQHDERFVLSGHIEGLASDTIGIFYEVPEFKLDTLVATQGQFELAFIPDTTTVFSLILDNKLYVPIVAEKAQRTSVKGSLDELSLKGGEENNLMNQQLSLLKTKQDDKEALKTAVDSLIASHPFSFTNLYLIRRYYTQENLFSEMHLFETIDKLGGIIKDTPYLTELSKTKEKTGSSKYVSHFTIPQKNGKAISRKDMADKYVLLNFWASWDKKSCAEQDSLTKLLKEFKKKDFMIIHVSLDMDRKAWLKACIEKKDSTQWRHICDFKGWDNKLVQQHDIDTLPANLLMDPKRDIIERDLRGQKLINRVKLLLKAKEQKDKEKKKK